MTATAPAPRLGTRADTGSRASALRGPPSSHVEWASHSSRLCCEKPRPSAPLAGRWWSWPGGTAGPCAYTAAHALAAPRHRQERELTPRPLVIDLDAKRAERVRAGVAAETTLAQCEAELAAGELSPEAQAALAPLAQRLARYAPAARRELARRRLEARHARRLPAPAAANPRTGPATRPREHRRTAAGGRTRGSPSSDEPEPPALAAIPLSAFRAELERAGLGGGGRP